MQEQQILIQMIALSRKKLEMLTDLKVLSEKQNKAFRDKAMDDIEKILNKKDESIAYIQKLDDAFLSTSEAIKKQLGIENLSALSQTNLKGKKELKSLIEEINEMVEAIIRLDQESYDSASMLKNEVGEKIKGVNAGKKVATAYTVKPSNSPSYFFDKKK